MSCTFLPPDSVLSGEDPIRTRSPERRRHPRSRLRALGVLRASGHEHFRGCLVIPVTDEHGVVGEVYGRRVDDHLKAGTPRHLYLPGPHRGVFNPAAFASPELIVCESLIDALTLWCAGFRHVTAAWGAGGWTSEHTALVRQHQVSRVLIAYDGDPAGDRGAADLGGELGPLLAECLRVPLPPGADINDVAVASKVARDALGGLLRHAAPIRQPAARPGPRWVREPSARPERAGDIAGAGAGAAQAVRAGSGAEPETPLPDGSGREPAPGPGDHRDPPATAGELTLSLADRRWRVRGLDKATSHGALRVNLLATRGERLHVDVLDLYSARSRQAFITAAAAELGVSAGVVKTDLGRVLLAAEEHAENAIAAARTPRDAQIVMSEAERAEALELLGDPDLISRITADFAAAGITGESAGCLALYLAAISRKLDRAAGGDRPVLLGRGQVSPAGRGTGIRAARGQGGLDGGDRPVAVLPRRA